MNINTIKSLPLFLLYYTAHCQEPIIEPSRPIINQEFKIKLATARSTSYDWYFKEISKQISPAGLLMPKEPEWVTRHGNATYSVNPGGTILKDETKIFTFKALHQGSVVLLFQKKHRYKTGTKVRESKEIKVTIQEK
jgi:Chagasin family peptidase inhibitor I42.